jgi:hypothetical protein
VREVRQEIQFEVTVNASSALISLLGASQETALRTQRKLFKYMLTSRHRNARQNYTITDTLFENIIHFKYLETTATNQIHFRKSWKRMFNLGNVCYHSVRIVSSYLDSKYAKIKMYTFTIVNRYSTVGIVTGYGLDGWRGRLRVPVGTTFVSSQPSGYQDLFPRT